MRTENISISSIDLQDTYYKYGSDIIPQGLNESIERFAILNPVKLIRENDRYRVICGWKRLYIISNFPDRDLVPSCVYNSGELSIPDCILIAFYDNFHRINELDKALLIKMLSEKGGISHEMILKEYLPVFGIPASYKNLEKFIALSKLEDVIKRSFYENIYSIDHLFLFSEIEKEHERHAIFDLVFKQYRYNINETREVVRNIREIASRENINIDDLVEEIANDKTGNIGKHEFRRILKKRRYPKISSIENDFSELIKQMDMDNSITLKHHPTFESNELEFRIRFDDTEQLSSSLNSIAKEVDRGKIQRIINFVREGHGT